MLEQADTTRLSEQHMPSSQSQHVAADMQKTNLLGMTRSQLAAWFEQAGEKPFRASQVMKWIYQQGVTDFAQMSNLSGALRQKLEKIAEIRLPTIVKKQFSADGTRKWVLQVATADGRGGLIETVLIPAHDKTGQRRTLCVSSQVGCALDCSFCSTGKQGFERDLTAAEIIAQVWIANQSYETDPEPGQHPDARGVTNVVMMGMGEPLLNFEPVVAAMDIMLDDFAFGLSRRRVTLSTSGIVPQIDALRERLDVALAISLHAPNDALRDELVPINRKYPLAQLIAAARRYVVRPDDQGEVSARRHVTIEYVMLAGVNDSDQHADELIALLSNLPSKINLIPFNPFPHAPYERSSRNRILAFQRRLTEAGLVCTIRQTRGDDIDAACGQLVGQVADRTRRQAQWQAKLPKREILRTTG